LNEINITLFLITKNILHQSGKAKEEKILKEKREDIKHLLMNKRVLISEFKYQENHLKKFKKMYNSNFWINIISQKGREKGIL